MTWNDLTSRDKKINLCATENDSSTPSEVADLLNQILQPVKGKSLAQINAQTTQQIYQKLRNSKVCCFKYRLCVVDHVVQNLEGTVYRVIRVALLFDVDQNLRFANRLVIGFTGSHEFALQYDLTQSKTVSWTGFGNMAYLLFDENGRIDTWSGKTKTTQHKVPLSFM